MKEKILLISEDRADLELLKKISTNDQFSISQTPYYHGIEDKILANNFQLILADYDLIGSKSKILGKFQKSRSKVCLIFYCEKIDSREATEILRKGVYTIIPRSLLSKYLYEAVIGGLENRKAFIEILGMMDESERVNNQLNEEKGALKRKNQELSFINNISKEMAYDLDWARILPRMIGVGLENILDYSLFTLACKIGTHWTLSLHITEKNIYFDKDTIKSELLGILLPKMDGIVDLDKIATNFIVPKHRGDRSLVSLLPELQSYPLNIAGSQFGVIGVVPKGDKASNKNNEEVITTLSNILSISLRNAQKYFKLKEEAVTDSLTGIYNRKGLGDILRKELQRAKRYDKPLSFAIIDIDNFKNINDSKGHQAGDHILREFAEYLRDSVRQPDTVARYGGDEFAILIPETAGKEAKMLLDRVTKNIRKRSFQWGSEKLKIGMSYGISNSGELSIGDREAELITRADNRLYESKTLQFS